VSDKHTPLSVAYKPEPVPLELPEDVEHFLFQCPGVSGFRLAGTDEKHVIVMVSTPHAAANLPSGYHGFTFEPRVTGTFRTY